MTRWTPESWRTKTALHMPADYPDPAALARVEDELRALPPLVFAGEARRLKAHLADAAAGRAFGVSSGEERQFDFTGAGTVLVQSSEKVRDDSSVLRTIQGHLPGMSVPSLHQINQQITQQLGQQQG